MNHPTIEYGLAQIRAWREEQSESAVRACAPLFPCPECGAAVSMVFGRHRRAYNGFHNGSPCRFKDCIWHLVAATVDAAKAEWAQLSWEAMP